MACTGVGRHAGAGQQLLHDLGIDAVPAHCPPGRAMQFVVAARRVERQQFGPQRRRKGAAGVAQHRRCRRRRNRPARRRRRPARCRTSGRCRDQSCGDVSGARERGAGFSRRWPGPRRRRRPARCAWRGPGARTAGRADALIGVPPSCCAMVGGSWYSPFTRNSKCRCGPVAQPVEPTAPIDLALAARSGPPGRRCGSGARRPCCSLLRCLTITMLP